MATVGLYRAVSAPLFDVELADLSRHSVTDAGDLILEVLHDRDRSELPSEALSRLEQECLFCADTGYGPAVAELIRIGREVQRIGHTLHVTGAAAGSMIAYSAGLTPLDPIEHGLLSERFMGAVDLRIPDMVSSGRHEDAVPDCFAAQVSMTSQEFLLVLRRLGYSLSAASDPVPELLTSIQARRRPAASHHKHAQLLVTASATDALANALGDVPLGVLEGDHQTWQLLHFGDTDGIDELDSPILRDALRARKPMTLLALADILAVTRHGTVPFDADDPDREPVYEEDLMKRLDDAMGVGLRRALGLIRRLAHTRSGSSDQVREWFFEAAWDHKPSTLAQESLWARVINDSPKAVCKANHVAMAYRCLKAVYFEAHYPAEFQSLLRACE